MAMFKERLPVLGSGLAYRSSLHEAIVGNLGRIDWLELIADQFLPLTPRNRVRLTRLPNRPMVPHSVDLSIGGLASPSERYVAMLDALGDAVAAPWISDHLAFTIVGGQRFSTFIPPRRDTEAIERVATRAAMVQRVTNRRLLLENISGVIDPGGSVPEAEFISRIARQADCGILLDLENLRSRCTSLGWDPIGYLEMLDLDRVVQVHLAGGEFLDGHDRDTHDRPVTEEVWALLSELTGRTMINAVVLERDGNYPDDFEEILAEIDRARRIAFRRRPSDEAHDPPTPPVPRRSSSTIPALPVRSQAELEAFFSITDTCEAASGEVLADVHRFERRRFWQSSGASRIDVMRFLLPATFRGLELYPAAVADRMLRLATSRPRDAHREDVLGQRASEAEAALGLLVACAAASIDSLVAVARLESAMAQAMYGMAAHGRDDRSDGRPECDRCRPTDDAIAPCANARARLAPGATLITAKFDVMMARQRLLDGDFEDLYAFVAYAVQEISSSYLAVAPTSNGSFRIHRLGPREGRLLEKYLAGTIGIDDPTADGRVLRETLRRACAQRIVTFSHAPVESAASP